MDATTAPTSSTFSTVSSLPAPPPRPPRPEDRTDLAAPEQGPGPWAVGAVVVGQILWLGMLLYAWVIGIFVLAWTGGEGLLGAGEDTGRWMALVTVAALTAAPIPTVAFIAARRRR